MDLLVGFQFITLSVTALTVSIGLPVDCLTWNTAERPPPAIVTAMPAIATCSDTESSQRSRTGAKVPPTESESTLASVNREAFQLDAVQRWLRGRATTWWA